MSQWADSSGGSGMQRSHGSQSASGAVAFPVGKESGLPLIRCPDCNLARIIENRSKKDNSNLGSTYFKCPRNAYPKLCGYYRFQRDYYDQLKELGIIQVRHLESEGIEEEGAEVVGNGKGVKVEAKDDLTLAKKMEELMARINMLVACIVAGIVVMLVFKK